MSFPDLIPAHFLSSSLPDESLLSAAFTQPTTKAKPSPPTKKSSTPSPTIKKHDLPWELPPLALGHSATREKSTPRPPSPPSRSRTMSSISNNNANTANGQPLPAPIGIPAARRRSPSAAACMRPPLSSSPTHTPFSVTPVGGAPARIGATATPISPILIPRTPSPGAERGTPGLSSGSSPVSSASPPSPVSNRRERNGATNGNGNSNANGTIAEEKHNGHLHGLHIHGLGHGHGHKPPSPTQSKRDTSPSSPRKARTWGRFFDFDNMLGALDPNRMAAASCPEPIKAVVFNAETETGAAVCRAMIAARHYVITALTVDEQCDAVRELKQHDVKVVAVDMDSPVSYSQELVGAKAVYLSSNVMTLHAILHHQHEPKRTEIARAADRCQLSKAVKACSRAKVGHVIFRVNACGHEVIENVLGKPKVVTEAPEDLDRLGLEHTVLHTSVPFNRITEWLEDSPKGLVLNVPVPDDTAIPFFSSEQTGDYVLAALRNPKKWAGKEMHAIASVMTPTQIAARLSKLSRRPVDTMHPTREEFMSFESHERLALRWDAWAQLVRHEYVPDKLATANKHDVPDEMDFDAWIAQDRVIHQRLKF